LTCFLEKIYYCAISYDLFYNSVANIEIQLKSSFPAGQLGFASEQSFYRNFKKFTGMTPAQWKKHQFPDGQ